MQKIKVLIAGDTLAYTSGLGKAIRIAKGLYDSEKYDVRYVVITGANSDIGCYKKFGEEYKDLFFSFNQIYNAQLQIQQNYVVFDQAIQVESPDIVLSILDPWNLDQIRYSSLRNNYFWINYALFETSFYSEYVQAPSFIKNNTPRKSIKEILQGTDLCIPVTNMGKSILEKWEINCSDNVYLGIDFDKRCKSKLNKSEVFKGVIKDSDFLFMTMGKNSERKKIDVVLESFAKFLKLISSEDKHKYKLYLHTDFNEMIGGTDILSQIVALGIQNNIVSCDCFIKGFELTEEELYKRYSVCDCYISLPAGEGFGYGYLESILHGKPVIYINYGGHVEYCSRAVGASVDVRSTLAARNIYMKWALADVKDASKKMKEIIKINKENAFIKNTELAKEFDWNTKILPKFINIIESNFVKKQKNKFNLKRIV